MHREPDQTIRWPPSLFLYIYLIIIFLSTVGSSKWSVSHRSPHQNPVYNSPVLHTCHMPCPSHISCSHFSKDIVLAVYVISSPSYSHSHSLLTSLLYPDIPLSKLILKNLHPKWLTHCPRPSFALIQNNKHNYVCLYLFFAFLDSTTEISESVYTTWPMGTKNKLNLF